MSVAQLNRGNNKPMSCTLMEDCNMKEDIIIKNKSNEIFGTLHKSLQYLQLDCHQLDLSTACLNNCWADLIETLLLTWCDTKAIIPSGLFCLVS